MLAVSNHSKIGLFVINETEVDIGPTSPVPPARVRH